MGDYDGRYAKLTSVAFLVGTAVAFLVGAENWWLLPIVGYLVVVPLISTLYDADDAEPEPGS